MSSLKKKLCLNSLPDDLLLNCFTRISRLYYPTLSLVSKRFQSLLASHELYNSRSLLDRTETCLYVCLRFCPFPYTYRWFTLSRKPDKTLTLSKNQKKASGYVLATVPIPHSYPVRFSGLVAVGSDIYSIGLTHFKLEATEMVAPGRSFARFSIQKHKFGILETIRDLTGRGVSDYMPLESYCEIENVLFCAFHGVLRWYDTKVQTWRILKGLVGLPEFLFRFDVCVSLANYGGKLAVLWDEDFPARKLDGCYEKRISCAVITLEKLKGSLNVFGNVEWFDHLLTVPKSCSFVKALAVTV